MASIPALPSLAQEVPLAQEVIVTGALRALRGFELPFAITAVDGETLRKSGPMVNLSESLGRVPGLVVSNRNNYAQDLQISSRGFGARAGFGVRGIRLYADGIPASMPDGQGQVAHFDLAGAARVEVLRGPFSVLYGNSSGGVIALFSAPVTEGIAELGLDAGSFGLRQARLSVASPLGGGLDVKASATHLELDGFRPQSEARRILGQVRLNWQGANDRWTLQVSDHEQQANDPLGLTRAQFDSDSRMTTPQATLFDTRKTIAQTQFGLNWRHAFEPDGSLRDLSISLYDGARDVTQWLAIAPATQANPRHGGGVVDFTRGFGGVDARLGWQWAGIDLAAGVTVERQTDDRRGYENFIGKPPDQQLGVTGLPRRSEVNEAVTRDGYVQLTAPLAAAWQLSAGVRGGGVRMETRDRYLSNGNDSGALRFDYTNPVLGLRWMLQPSWALFASAARGSESPTLGELAYRPDSGAGFNTELHAQHSRHFEAGSKWRSPTLDFEATLFDVRTDHEIGVQTNSGGRSTFQNVGRTRRYGAELGAAWRPDPAWRLQVALTVLKASYLDDFKTCTAVPCANANVPVPAGNRIAGTSRGSVWAELGWRPGNLPGEVALEWRAQGSTTANDVNSEAAPGLALTNLRWSNRWELGDGHAVEALARVDNLAGKVHVGSVIVNDTNARFYEPGAPRSLLLSTRWIKRW